MRQQKREFAMFGKICVRALAAASLAMALTACGGEAPEEPTVSAPEAPAGIVVENGWMALPAVAGNPGAVYFTISNSSDKQATIRSAYVAGAESAMLHETAEYSGQMDMQELISQPVMPGESVTFEPGGKHVMAMNIDGALAAGGETEVTLTFAGGDKISFPVALYAAGTQPEEADEGSEG